MNGVVAAATLMLMGLAPRVSLAQWRSVADEEPVKVELSRPSAASAREEWEEALADRITDAGTWSAIGQRLYSTGQYRESIVAFEKSFVQRKGQSPDDARFIADAYTKLGNVKQASRWRAAAVGAAVPSRRTVATAV